MSQSLSERVRQFLPFAPDENLPGHTDYFIAIYKLEDADTIEPLQACRLHELIEIHPTLSDLEKMCLHIAINIKIQDA